MKPARFTYHDARTLEDAFALLVEHGDEAKVIAGGQSLVAVMNFRMAQPEHLIDINGIAELNGIDCDGVSLRVGALTCHADIVASDVVRSACPILIDSGKQIGHYAIRQRGTIGGSLSYADPAAEWPMMAVLMDAEIEVAQPSGNRRRVRAGDFIQSIFTTDLASDELLTQVSFPCLKEGEGWAFKSFARRQGDYYIVAAGATMALDGSGRVERVRLALGGMDVTAIRLTEIEQEARGEIPDQRWIEKIAERARSIGDPADDQNADAEFRRELAQILIADALTEALDRSGSR